LNPIPLRAAILATLAGLGLAHPAQAEPGRWPPTYFMAGIGFGASEAHTEGVTESTTSVMVGYRFNQYVGVQAIGFQFNNVSRQPSNPAAPAYDFDAFRGVQVVGFLPCTSYWDIVGEAGGGQSRYTSATPGTSSNWKGDGLTGVGLRWQITDHLAASLDVTRVWDARVTHGSLRAEVNF
jgi:hypothetical protein